MAGENINNFFLKVGLIGCFLIYTPIFTCSSKSTSREGVKKPAIYQNLGHEGNLHLNKYNHDSNYVRFNKYLVRPDSIPPHLQISGLASYSKARQERLLKWRELASGGNPFIRIVENHYRDEVNPHTIVTGFASALDQENAWQIASGARQMMRLSFAGADPRSRHFKREDLVESAFQLGDTIIGRIEEQGWWIGPDEGDPNINRFTMVPLLASLRYLSNLPEFDGYWEKWKKPLWEAVKFHRRGHREGSEIKTWDYGARFSPQYPNMDAAYICILGLAADLFNEPGLLKEARHRMELLHEMVLPGGGIGYIHEENEINVYHNVNACFIGLYYKVTRDPLARRLLDRMGGFFPSVLTAEGDPEMWTAGWWKQRWMQRMQGNTMVPQDPSGMAILATLNDDAEGKEINKLLWASLSRIEPSFNAGNTPDLNNWTTLFALDYWPGGEVKLPQYPEKYFNYDANRRGFRGKNGAWYYGLMKGRGQRNTFVGGIISEEGKSQPVRGVFRGATIHVFPENQTNGGEVEELWLSGRQNMDYTTISWSQDRAALGAHYTLQPRRYGDRSDLAPSPWRVVQCWVTGPNGTLGIVRLENTGNENAKRVLGKINIGPEKAKEMKGGIYKSGKLATKVFNSFGEVKIIPSNDPRTNLDGVKPWPAIGFEKHNWKASKDESEYLTYSTWIGPEKSDPPAKMNQLSINKDSRWVGWIAEWENGRQTGVIFNPEKSRKAKIPLQYLRDWGGIFVNGRLIDDLPSQNNYSLPAGGVMLLIKNP